MPKARKRFGQHFLHDKQIIERLVQVINPCPDQHIVEIGPGQGALTVPLLKKAGQIDVVEIDWDLIPALELRCKGKGNLVAHQADALEFDFHSLVKTSELLRVVGNLPYNISTPLIFHLLEYANTISDMHFMLQKEVVDRMASPPGSEDYGRLSIMVQYHCSVSALFDVPPEAFYPPPKVQSRVVRLIPHQEIQYIAHNYKHFADLVKLAFSHRRKTLRNCFKTIMPDSVWAETSIDPGLRPEQLGVTDYINLSNILSGQ